MLFRSARCGLDVRERGGACMSGIYGKQRAMKTDRSNGRLVSPGAALATLIIAAFFAPAFGAAATNFPDKPIRWIVPYPAGGAADLISRPIAQKLAEKWSQQIVIDNRPGAGGNLGIELAAKAPPTGYTQVVVPATITTMPSLNPKLAYDPVRD